jgi:hypothetical protein
VAVWWAGSRGLVEDEFAEEFSGGGVTCRQSRLRMPVSVGARAVPGLTSRTVAEGLGGGEDVSCDSSYITRTGLIVMPARISLAARSISAKG